MAQGERTERVQRYLGIDCGTQGTKALLIDRDGEVHGRGYAAHELVERPSGAREQDPMWWITALCAAVKQALHALPKGAVVRALGVSGQQHGLVVLDENRKVIRPAKLWNDTETAKQNAEIIHRLGGKQSYFERFGIVPLTGYTVSKLLWISEVEPENFSKIRHILLPHEYLNFWLTGKMRAEAGDASGTGFFDVRSRLWTREVLDSIDGTGQLFAALPDLIDADEAVGTLRPEIAKELGLPVNCIVSSGGGDNMMGAIGTGNVKEGVVTLSLGTSSTVYSYSERPVLDETGSVAPFCSSSGGWLPLVCTMNATNLVSSTVKILGKTVLDIEDALESTKPGADGLTFLPFLNGERTPDLPRATGSLMGITPGNFTDSHFIRAAIEGVSFGILSGLDLVLSGKPVSVIKVIGGGARSTAWRQLLADATGATIHLQKEEEAGCLGAAMQSMAAVAKSCGSPVSFADLADRIALTQPSGSSVPRAELRPAYDAARSTFRHYFQMLYPNSV